MPVGPSYSSREALFFEGEVKYFLLLVSRKPRIIFTKIVSKENLLDGIHFQDANVQYSLEIISLH